MNIQTLHKNSCESPKYRTFSRFWPIPTYICKWSINSPSILVRNDLHISVFRWSFGLFRCFPDAPCMVYQLNPKTRKSNVFSKHVRFCYWCWNSSACWIWCENLFRHAFLGFLWRSEGGNGSTWDACRVFWHLFLVCLLRNLPSIASCNQPFLFGTVLVFLWGWFFSELVFFAMMGAHLPLWPRSF